MRCLPRWKVPQSYSMGLALVIRNRQIVGELHLGPPTQSHMRTNSGATAILSKVHTRWISSLECQYAVQQEDIEMIPLMMEQGCENTAVSLYQYVHHGLARRHD